MIKKDMFFLLAGPCVIENEKMAMEIAEQIVSITQNRQIPYVFKGSYKKANRSKATSFTGIGDEKALRILKKIGNTFHIQTLTDIHESKDASLAAEYVDILQIPAFLCRQTDLLTSAAKTGKIVNIKKGQFLSPISMKFAVEKITENGNHQILLTERGTMFGYTDLIVDYRGIPEMKKLGFPVVMDVTHSIQQPNQANGTSEGNPVLIETIAKAAVAVGVDGLFIETHPEPFKALSDRTNMLPLHLLDSLLDKLVRIRKVL